MTFTLMILAGAAVLELVLFFKPLWPARRPLAAMALLATAFGSGMLLTVHYTFFSVVVLALGLYRLLNLMRIIEQRMQAHYLYYATRRTSVVLLGLQVATGAAWWLWDQWHETGHLVWAAVGIVQVVVALLLWVSVRRTMRHTQWPHQLQHYTDTELPTVTVAIPARNETEDLQQCLQAIIRSDYPKLEVIVLDDCSQTRRTPEIIRAFAHDGVRFVPGMEPKETWLPKNHAYDRLAQEASGEYLLFCGVDIRLAPQTIRSMVSLMLERKKAMLSILPRREDDARGHHSLVQAMRYWWELVPPRRLLNRPPVLSSCWMITSQALHDGGGFAAVARTIVPEAYFARVLTKQDGYSFLRATTDTGITSSKQLLEQRETALRVRYPQLHRRPEHVALLAAAQMAFLLAPFLLAVLGFWVSIGLVAHVSATLAAVVLVAVYRQVVLATHANAAGFSWIGHPLMVLADGLLLHWSMLKYEFSEVDWKGRNVCVPVMRTIPHLPRMDSPAAHGPASNTGKLHR